MKHSTTLEKVVGLRASIHNMSQAEVAQSVGALTMSDGLVTVMLLFFVNCTIKQGHELAVLYGWNARLAQWQSSN